MQISDKIIQLVIGLAIVALIWFVFLPLLSGVVHTVALILVVVLTILWLLRLAGVIS